MNSSTLTIVTKVVHPSLLVCLIACSPKAEAPVGLPKAKPEWVRAGSTLVVRGDKRVFVGVGVATNIKNVALKRSTADNRARAEITKLFETFGASTMQDFMSSKGHTPADELHVSAAIMGFSAVTLGGVEVKDHYEDPSDGAIYASAELDTDAFVAALPKLKELPDSIRDFAKARATNNFDALRADQEAELRTPGICRQRIHIVELKPSSDNCAIDLATQLPLVRFPCAGGEISVFFGTTPMKGRVGAAGSIHLEGTGVGRQEGACTYQMSSAIVGQLKGEITFSYAEQAAGPGCAAPCSGEAKVATE